MSENERDDLKTPEEREEIIERTENAIEDVDEEPHAYDDGDGDA